MNSKRFIYNNLTIIKKDIQVTQSSRTIIGIKNTKIEKHQKI